MFMKTKTNSLQKQGIEPKVKVRKEKQNSAYLQWLHAFARIQS